MINKPEVDKLLEKVDNRYELICIIAKRARQLQAGSKPMVKTDMASNITIASLEFDQNKYNEVK